MQTDGDMVEMSAAEFASRFDAAMATELRPGFARLAAAHAERTGGDDEIVDMRVVGNATACTMIVEWRSGARFELPFALIGNEH